MTDVLGVLCNRLYVLCNTPEHLTHETTVDDSSSWYMCVMRLPSCTVSKTSPVRRALFSHPLHVELLMKAGVTRAVLHVQAVALCVSCVVCVCLCATDRNDFSDDPLKVTFEAGSVLSSYVGVDIVDDSIMEENETFICVILKSTQFEKDDLLTEDPDVATIAILDSDCKCTSTASQGHHWSCRSVAHLLSAHVSVVLSALCLFMLQSLCAPAVYVQRLRKVYVCITDTCGIVGI